MTAPYPDEIQDVASLGDDIIYISRDEEEVMDDL